MEAVVLSRQARFVRVVPWPAFSGFRRTPPVLNGLTVWPPRYGHPVRALKPPQTACSTGTTALAPDVSIRARYGQGPTADPPPSPPVGLCVADALLPAPATV